MINNNVLVTFTTQNSPIFTSQHLIPYKRAINFLYQPKVSQRAVKAIPIPQKMHASVLPKQKIGTPRHKPAKNKTMLKMISTQLKRHEPNIGNKIKPKPSMVDSLSLMKSGSPKTAE